MTNKENLDVIVTQLQIIDPKEKSVAALGLNESFVWAKFILTDDKPNGNKQRIPKSEFPNLIRSGLYTPIKMKAGQIGEGHEESYPIGVVTTLREDTRGDTNLIVGLAALWSEERPDDVQTISEMYANKKPLDVSWEISHASTEETEDGITDIKGAILTGTTLVKIPAYGGRTFIDELLYASKEGEDDDEKTEDLPLDDKEKFEELTTSLNKSVSEAAVLKTEVEALTEKVETLTDNQVTDEMTNELEELKTFKTDAEAALELEEKRVAIKAAFNDAGLGVDEDYFKENDKILTNMDESSLGFFIDTLKAAQSTEVDETSGKKKSSLVPKLNTSDDDDVTEYSGSDLGKALFAQKYSEAK